MIGHLKVPQINNAESYDIVRELGCTLRDKIAFRLSTFCKNSSKIFTNILCCWTRKFTPVFHNCPYTELQETKIQSFLINDKYLIQCPISFSIWSFSIVHMTYREHKMYRINFMSWSQVMYCTGLCCWPKCSPDRQTVSVMSLILAWPFRPLGDLKLQGTRPRLVCLAMFRVSTELTPSDKYLCREHA